MFANPYIFSVVQSPPAAGATLAQPSIHIHLASTLAHRQTVTFPAPSAGSLAVSAVTVAPSASRAERAHLVLVSTPTDRNLLQSEGSTVWELRGADVSEEVDELVREGRMIDAIGLVEAVGDTNLAPVGDHIGASAHVFRPDVSLICASYTRCHSLLVATTNQLSKRSSAITSTLQRLSLCTRKSPFRATSRSLATSGCPFLAPLRVRD